MMGMHARRMFPVVICFVSTVIVVVLFRATFGNAMAAFSYLSPSLFDSYKKTFFVFFFIGSGLMGLAFFGRSSITSFLLLLLATLSLYLSAFTVPHDFPLLLCMLVALVTVTGKAIEVPFDFYGVYALVSLFFVLYNKSASVIAASLITPQRSLLPWQEQVALATICVMVGQLVCLDKWMERESECNHDSLVHERLTLKQLSRFNQQLQDRAKEAGDISAENERNRITREMHDSNGYAFTNIIALMNAAISSGNKDWNVIEDILQTTLQQAKSGLQESRATLHRFREEMKDVRKLGLADSICQTTRIFQECTGVAVQVSYGNVQYTYGTALDRMVDRVLQEALTNSLRHGQATLITVQLWETSDSMLSMLVEDNGIGSVQIVKGIGLTGMEERAREFHGSVSFSSLPQGGFKLCIAIPVPGRED